jgi:DnaJ homolog subfamily C member 19
MLILLALFAVILAWAWLSGRLRSVTLDDAIAASLFLLGGRLLVTGRSLPGAVLMAGALLYAGYRRGRFTRRAMPLDDARRLLGVSPEASLADIRAAHRRLIARVHPDAGGSAELASRINEARDALIADLSRGGGRRGDSLR